MKQAAYYAVVRFQPFVETGEFANVGVVLFSPEARFFGFRLLANRYARVTNFFEQLDPRVFRTSIRMLRDELERVDDLLKGLGTDRRLRSLDAAGANALWGELVKPRETIVRFGEQRLVVAEDVRAKLNTLYAYYVERNFVTREYQEKVLDRGVREMLRQARLSDRYFAARIGNDEYHTQFPFVAHDEGRPVAVIKPLNLAYSEASRIIDHGGQWVVRINALRKRRLLPEFVLFAVDGPIDHSIRGEAVQEVEQDLERAGVVIRRYGDRQAVLEFAESHVPHRPVVHIETPTLPGH
jgi:hypothetical protein